jgi:alkylation response protein AidB-like acyl-CoA dehydrogenase
MSESLTADQHLLLDTTARFIAEWSASAAAGEKRRHSDGYRRRAADLGWFSLLVPEDDGGGSISGRNVLDACLVAFQRGRLLHPGAFVATNVAAQAIATAGDVPQRAAILPDLLSGSRAGTWVAPLAKEFRAVRDGGDYYVTGAARLIEDPGHDGIVVLTADTADGPTQFVMPADVPGLSIVPMDSLDISRQFVEICCAGAKVPESSVLGQPGAAAEASAQQLALACVLLTAESVGSMDFELAMTVQYAKERIAFGRPIGSFQAIKHLLADTSLALELAKACVVAAADHLDRGENYARSAASLTKFVVGENGRELAQNCFQVFGGIGFTWEHDQHRYLRRLCSDAALYGDPAWHRERLCQLGGI